MVADCSEMDRLETRRLSKLMASAVRDRCLTLA